MRDQIAEEFIALLKQHAQEIGQELKGDLEAVKQYAAERISHLSTIVGQAGFIEALKAERDSIALRAASAAVGRADAIDARVLSFIQGALAIGARALTLA